MKLSDLTPGTILTNKKSGKGVRVSYVWPVGSIFFGNTVASPFIQGHSHKDGKTYGPQRFYKLDAFTVEITE